MDDDTVPSPGWYNMRDNSMPLFPEPERVPLLEYTMTDIQPGLSPYNLGTVSPESLVLTSDASTNLQDCAMGDVADAQ